MNPIELPMAPEAPATGTPDAREAAPRPPGDARRFRVDGMDCGACAKSVEKAVSHLSGVHTAEVSFGTATLVVHGEAPDEDVTAAVGRAGYRARPADGRTTGPARPFWRADARAISTSLAVGILAVAALASLSAVADTVATALYLLSMAVGGWPIARAAAGALRRGALDMNVLMALAAVGAVGIGEYAEGAWVLVLFAVGTGLEAMALDRSRRSVEALMDLSPAHANAVIGGREQSVAVEEVTPGTEIVVRPGERLPLDGIVVSGASSVDQAPITGESVPADKQAGDEVYAGTLNTTGSIIVRATRPASASTLSRIAELVAAAQGSRAPAERFIDRFARIYTPLVFLSALALATVPPALGGDPDTWVYRALALLIVACPCSLVISVPVAVVSAIGGAARRGILITGGQALEDLGRVRAVALDKTGTLTWGLPRLETVLPRTGLDADSALGLLAAVEQGSEHPLAAAVRRAAREQHVTVPAAEAFAALPGRGAQAHVDGRALWAGGPRLAAELTGSVPVEVEELHAGGQTAIVLGHGPSVLAVFGLSDRLRSDARALADRLSAVGVRRIVMLTGDSEPVARAVAAQAGLAEWHAGLLPEEKLTAVARMERESGSVAMVGDGVNDAPALAAARVGVAMGAAGSDVAIGSADVALMSDRLDRLPDAIAQSRRALSVMRANVIASLIIKGVLVALAPFGLVTLVVAVAADMGMSLLVTLNAMRLLRMPGATRR